MGIGEKLSSRYSPPRRGGEGCGINKSREATEEAADGVVSSAKCLGLNSFAELLLRLRPIGLALRATPAAPISERIHFIDGASTPPLRGGEYPELNFSSIRSHLVRPPLQRKTPGGTHGSSSGSSMLNLDAL